VLGSASVEARLEISDETLFAQYVETRCESSFAQLHERYHARLLRFVSVRINDAAHAEDIVQNVFVRILGAADRFDVERSFKSWVGRIAANLVKNYYRDHGRRRVIHEGEFITRGDEDSQDTSPIARAATTETPATVLQETLLSEQMESALNQLPDDYREIFTLRHIEGYSIAEAAEILGLPHGAAKARSTRARRKMLDLMSPAFDEGEPPPPT
jgi:RNA polymerase sigma-70 factor (ECF subfamily)